LEKTCAIVYPVSRVKRVVRGQRSLPRRMAGPYPDLSYEKSCTFTPHHLTLSGVEGEEWCGAMHAR